MVIEQKNGKHIDLDDIVDLYPEEIMFDANDISLVGKFIIVAKYKNGNKCYLTNIFDYIQTANSWIYEIAELQTFVKNLEKYKI